MTLLMISALVGLLFLFFVAFLYVLYKNRTMKALHSKKMEQLRVLFFSLHQHQKALHTKLLISDQYDLNYKKEVKALGDEVVALQKVFLEVISNQKNK